jgi:hypothetical protein
LKETQKSSAKLLPSPESTEGAQPALGQQFLYTTDGQTDDNCEAPKAFGGTFRNYSFPDANGKN